MRMAFEHPRCSFVRFRSHNDVSGHCIDRVGDAVRRRAFRPSERAAVIDNCAGVSQRPVGPSLHSARVDRVPFGQVHCLSGGFFFSGSCSYVNCQKLAHLVIPVWFEEELASGRCRAQWCSSSILHSPGASSRIGRTACWTIRYRSPSNAKALLTAGRARTLCIKRVQSGHFVSMSKPTSKPQSQNTVR